MKNLIYAHIIGLLALSPTLFGATSDSFSLNGTEQIAVTVSGNFDENLIIVSTDTNATVFYSSFLATRGGDWTTPYTGNFDSFGSGAMFSPGDQGVTLSGLPAGNYYIATALGSGADASYSTPSGNGVSLSDFNSNWGYGATCDVVLF